MKSPLLTAVPFGVATLILPDDAPAGTVVLIEVGVTAVFVEYVLLNLVLSL